MFKLVDGNIISWVGIIWNWIFTVGIFYIQKKFFLKREWSVERSFVSLVVAQSLSHQTPSDFRTAVCPLQGLNSQISPKYYTGILMHIISIFLCILYSFMLILTFIPFVQYANALSVCIFPVKSDRLYAKICPKSFV